MPSRDGAKKSPTRRHNAPPRRIGEMEGLMKHVPWSALIAIATAACSPGDLDPSLRALYETDAGSPPPGVADSTPLEGCPKFPTVGAFEKELMLPRCGTASCHGAAGRPFAPDLHTLPVSPRLLDHKVTAASSPCDKAKALYLDSHAAPEDSYLVSKVRDPMPKCPDGRAGGLRMPYAAKDPLPDDEIACFVSYARALTVR
jgi:hypothetical protein